MATQLSKVRWVRIVVAAILVYLTSFLGELRYYAYGATRASSGATPTNKQWRFHH